MHWLVCVNSPSDIMHTVSISLQNCISCSEFLNILVAPNPFSFPLFLVRQFIENAGQVLHMVLCAVCIVFLHAVVGIV